MSDSIAIRIENLSKVFGRGKKRVEAVKNINLEIRSGQVYGFLGPNGAGKTTTIRMLLDLIRPTTGKVSLFNQDVRREPQTLRRVGALVEGATFYPFLTGRRNLEVLARTSDCYDPARINRLLAQMDMADRRVNGYSTGMKQRLGVAGALLSDPDLVILDEPTNGLDPAGIQEMRVFIRDLVDKQGKTVFLSSHLLSEVEQVCDRVAIINHGEIIREGTVAELLSSKAQLRVEAVPLDKVVTALAGNWTVVPNGVSVTIDATRNDVPHIVRKLVEHGVDIYQVADQRQTLEEYFLSVTQTEVEHGEPVSR